MDDKGIFVRLGSGEDLLATNEGEDGVSVDIPESMVIIPSAHVRLHGRGQMGGLGGLLR